ncbi:hypothetical protein GCM10028793_24680 [Nocardiopsis oceani]
MPFARAPPPQVVADQCVHALRVLFGAPAPLRLRQARQGLGTRSRHGPQDMCRAPRTWPSLRMC